MKVKNKTIKVDMKKEFDFVDLTDEVEAFVKESDIKNGLVNIQSLHTTASIIVNENEPLLMKILRSTWRSWHPETLSIDMTIWK